MALNTSSPTAFFLPHHLRHPWLLGGAVFVALMVLLPLVALIGIASTAPADIWPHLIQYVIPPAGHNTIVLMILVSIFITIFGVVSAWLVSEFEFPGHRYFAWLHILPLAVPVYLAAYGAGEFFHYSGPLQTAYRDLFGFQTIRDYWFFEIRSTGGAALVLSSVLYPYVFLSTRFAFVMQGQQMVHAARALGAGPLSVFFRILLPASWPAVAVGVSLALMEALNDIGGAEYLGVQTITIAMYNTWLNRSSIGGAAQMALVLLVIVLFLLWLERYSRGVRQFHSDQPGEALFSSVRHKLRPASQCLAILFNLIPITLGLLIPVYTLGGYAWRRPELWFEGELFEALAGSLLIASLTTVVTLGCALLLAYLGRTNPSRTTSLLRRIATSGYAVPGTIIALGLLMVLGAVDNWISSWSLSLFGFKTGLLLTGSLVGLTLAYSIRFLALAEANLTAGFEKIPKSLDAAARSLGHSENAAAWAVTLPLLKPALLTAAMIVFVDSIKELSATLLLRPFDFSTLATYVYDGASRGRVELGAPAAILIIFISMLPAIWLARSVSR